MRNKFFYISMFLMIVGCGQKSMETKYYSSGEIQSEKFKIDEKDFITKKYYKNGKIKSEYQTYNFNDSSDCKLYDGKGIFYRLDKYHKGEYSYSIDYFCNKKVKSIGKYENNIPYGWFSYYDSVVNFLNSRKQVFILQDSSIAINQEIYFNENGDTLKSKSFYFSLYSIKDTVNLGEEYQLIVKLDAPFCNENMEVLVENLDDTSTVTIYRAKNFITTCKVKPIKKGAQLINGQISNYRYLKKGETSTSKYYDKENNTVGRFSFFEKEFYVK
jgi:hypothetical protein